VYTSNVRNIRFLGEFYESGEVTINEEEKTIGISQLNKSFFTSKMVFVKQVDYTHSSVVSSDGLTVKIDNITFDAQDKHVVDSITEIVTRPRRAEWERREKIVSSADASILNFLQERATTLKDLGELKSDPRETMLKLKKVSEGEDPLVLVKGMLEETLKSPFASMEAELNNLKFVVNEAKMQSVHALIYGIAEVQTSMLLGADPAKPLSLLEKVAVKKLNMEDLSGLSLIEATGRLYSEATIMNPKTLLG
jgi:chorismate mutase